MQPSPVVAAAIVRDARVLAARRTSPPELAGRWELPGGKVDPGESDAQALARECREELGVAIAVGERLGPELTTASGRVLRAYLASLLEGEPQALDHGELRWLGAGQLGEVDWLPTDLALLPALADALTVDPAAARRPR